MTAVVYENRGRYEAVVIYYWVYEAVVYKTGVGMRQ